MIRIAIDDGHGMETAGKRTPSFSDGTVMKENEFNSAVAEYLAMALQKNGFAVIKVAPEQTDTSLQTRVRRANDSKADAYISIHANAYGSDWNQANGVESLIYSKVIGGSLTDRFAHSIHKNLVSACGLKDRGIKKSDDLYVLRTTKMHAILVECGFMTNRKEAELLCSDTYRQKVADGLCKGICEFYGKTFEGGKKMEQTVQEAIETVQKKAGLEEKTMEFLLNYKYGESLVQKLARAMK